MTRKTDFLHYYFVGSVITKPVDDTTHNSLWNTASWILKRIRPGWARRPHRRTFPNLPQKTTYFNMYSLDIGCQLVMIRTALNRHSQFSHGGFVLKIGEMCTVLSLIYFLQFSFKKPWYLQRVRDLGSIMARLNVKKWICSCAHWYQPNCMFLSLEKKKLFSRLRTTLSFPTSLFLAI